MTWLPIVHQRFVQTCKWTFCRWMNLYACRLIHELTELNEQMLIYMTLISSKYEAVSETEIAVCRYMHSDTDTPCYKLCVRLCYIWQFNRKITGSTEMFKYLCTHTVVSLWYVQPICLQYFKILIYWKNIRCYPSESNWIGLWKTSIVFLYYLFLKGRIIW